MEQWQKVKDDMYNMAEMLIRHTWPIGKFEDEKDVLCLKQKIVDVDGYEIILCFSRADYGDFYVDSLQIQSCRTPFLPFRIVCKMAKLFFGENMVSYVEFFKSNKKVYCWVIKHDDTGYLDPSNQTVSAEHEGYEYKILDPSTVDLF